MSSTSKTSPPRARWAEAWRAARVVWSMAHRQNCKRESLSLYGCTCGVRRRVEALQRTPLYDDAYRALWSREAPKQISEFARVLATQFGSTPADVAPLRLSWSSYEEHPWFD